MTIVTVVTSVSYRYYEKRNRSVAEQNIRSMCHALGREPPTNLAALAKDDLIHLALRTHAEMPE